MTGEATNSNEEPNDKRKSERVPLGVKRPQITITEEYNSGKIERIVDPSEFGISAPQTTAVPPTTSVEMKETPTSTSIWHAEPKRPCYPTIYEESFGGVHRTIVTLDELSARLK
jgi:hypothetical protein